ncbi:MAG: hypothetical protein U0L49_03740 [Eubacterium sp.]|nr:hypothetical protein [Eubacterium sp.]
MRDFLLANCRTLICVILIAEIILAVLFFRLYAREKKIMLLCLALIDLGLIIDAALIVAGVGPKVSVVRFVAHGVLLPLNLPVIGYACRFKERTMKVIWILTAVIMVLGCAQGFLGKLELVEFAGLSRYTQSKDNAGWIRAVSGLLSFGVILPQLAGGIYAWIKQKNPFLFLSAFAMYAFTALAPATGNVDLLFFISMFGEVLMMLFYYIFVGQFLKAEKN